MTITVYPITPSFAVEIGDVDLSGPLPPADLAAIKEAFAKYAVLVFPGQHLSPEQHLDFAGQFGPLETTIAVHRGDSPLRLAKEFADVSNLDHNSGYAQRSFSLAAYAGQTITVKFTGTEDSELQTSFVIDDTSLTVS